MSISDKGIDVSFTLDDYHTIRGLDFPAQLQEFGFREEERRKLIADCDHLRDILCILDHKESWEELGIVLRTPVKLRLRRFQELGTKEPSNERDGAAASAIMVYDALEAGKALEEAEMAAVGRAESIDRTHKAIQIQRTWGQNIKTLTPIAVAHPLGLIFVAAKAVMFSYMFFKGEITGQQLAKHITVDFVTSVGSQAGAVGGILLGVMLGTAIVPGIGTFIGGIVGYILGSLICGKLVHMFASWLGDKAVNEEEHTRIVERKKQYAEALRIFGLQGVALNKELVEQTKRALYKAKHPDKFPGDKDAQAKAHADFISVCAAYYVILHEHGWDGPLLPTSNTQLPLLLTSTSTTTTTQSSASNN